MGLFGNGSKAVDTPEKLVTSFDVTSSTIVPKGRGHYILPGPELLSTWYGVKHTAQSSFVLHFEVNNEKVVLYLSKTEAHEDLPEAGRCCFGYAVFKDEKKNFVVAWADNYQKLLSLSASQNLLVSLVTEPQSARPLFAKVSFPGDEKMSERLAGGELPIKNMYITQVRSYFSEVVCSAMLENQGGKLSPRDIMLNKLASMSSDKTYSRSDLEALGIQPTNVNIAIENLRFPVLEEIEKGTFVFYAHTLQRYIRDVQEKKAAEESGEYKQKTVKMKGTDGKTYRLRSNEDGIIDGSDSEVVEEGDE